MANLIDLHDRFGQSPWLDNLHREWIATGELGRWVERGIRGITSNPTIFAKAMEKGNAYDAQLRELLTAGVPVEQAFWELAISDITEALAVLRPVYDASGGDDGFVSLEVDPGLARDTDGTIEAARTLHARIDQPNLYIKIPATAEGVPAIRQTIAEGNSVNVTLIFSLERYAEVMEAYLSGLEACEGDLSGVSSVASFFVSRVDSEVDSRLDAATDPAAETLKGKTAVAQAKMAYQLFTETFSGQRWEALAARGARVQRPLWASTSTKNPAYPDTLYVDHLIGPRSVNTMPETTIEAFDDHGTLARTIDEHVANAKGVLESLPNVGVDLADVADKLERDGVASFAQSFDDLLAGLRTKAAELGG
ncbi:MAG: transaldolase [Actinomycetota bacterium]|nr:transaldolase [Actinomycetota bacterium]